MWEGHKIEKVTRSGRCTLESGGEGEGVER